MTMLTSCAEKRVDPDVKVVVTGNVPLLPENLRSRTPDPGIRAGKPAKVELARNRAAFKSCDAEQVSFITYYDGLYKAQPKAR